MGEAAVVSFELERMKRVFRGRRGDIVAGLNRTLDEAEGKTIEGLKSGKHGLMDYVRGAREVARAVEAAATTALIESHGPEELRATMATCEGCGRTLRMKQMDLRTVETMSGEVTIRRPYFYCEKCRRGVHPADGALGLAPGRKQFEIQEASTLLTTEIPFERASTIFKKITGREISTDLAHDTANEMAEGLDVLDVAPTAAEVRAMIERATTSGRPKPVLLITLDGAMVATRPDAARGERPGPKKTRANRANWVGEWREEKGFRLILVLGDRIEQIMSWHQVMTDDELEEALMAVRDAGLVPADLTRICVAADGAKWIWKVAKRVFPQARQVLDYYHMKDHLYEFANLKYGKESERATAWVNATKARICAGQVDAVLAGLQRMRDDRPEAVKACEDLVTYLDGNRHRIDYDALRAEGYPLGSGAIESAHKFISHVRMKRSGAWWYVANCNRILALRCAVYNGTFDRVCVRHQERVLKQNCPKSTSPTLKKILDEVRGKTRTIS